MKKSKLVVALSVIVFVAMLFAALPTHTEAAEDYRAWAQTDYRWSAIPLGNSSVTIGSHGCLVTSVTKLIIQSGLRDASNFNVATLANWLNNNAGYVPNTGNLYYAKPSECVPGFGYYGQILAGTYYSAEYNDYLLNYISSGYHMVVMVGGHYVAIDEAKSLATGTIYIMDSKPGVTNADISLASRYPVFYEVLAYTGGSTPIASYTPTGTLDVCEGGSQSVRVRGWVYDRDNLSREVTIHVYVGPICVGIAQANQYRPDVDSHPSHLGVGKYHGYDYTFDVPENLIGTQNVRVYALDEESDRHPELTGANRTVQITKKETIISYETIKEGTYAIKCPAAGSYVTVQDNADVVGQNIIATTARTGFEITKSSTTEGYAVRALCSASRMMNVYTEYVTSGNTVCLWDDTGHASQRWYFEKVSGGYVIRSVQTPSCVLTVEGDGDIGVATYSGTPGQIWTLEPYCESHKYSSATCTKPKTCTNCGATSGKALGHSYTNACDTTCNRSGCKTTRKTTHSYKNGKCATCGKADPSAKAVKITTQPKNVVVKSGKTAKVTVNASGDGLKYTWYYAKKGATKWTKTSSKTSSFSVKMSSSYDGCRAYCVITDKYGSTAKSSTVTLYKGTPAKITTQPKSTTVVLNETGRLTLKASGTGLKYTWYVKNKGATSFTKTSTTSNTYSFKMADKLNGAQVYCVVKDKYGTTVKSSAVTIKLAPKVKITTQPKNVAVAKGKTAKVTVKASGEGLKYTWYYAKKGSSSFKKLSAKSATYSVKMSSTYDGRKVYCVVTDKYGQTVKTGTVTLSMVKTAKITTQPKSVSGFAGNTLKVTVKASGDGLKYTWYYAKKGASDYTKSSVTCNAIQVKASAAWNGCKIYCVVKDKYGNSVKSSVVTLTVKNAAKITQQPSSVSVANGSTAKVTVKATGDGLKYTWYYANKGATKWTKTSVTSATYSVKMSSSVNGRRVYCIVKDKYGNSVKSSVVTLSISNDFERMAGSWGPLYVVEPDGTIVTVYTGRVETERADAYFLSTYSDGTAMINAPFIDSGSYSYYSFFKIEFIKKSGDKYTYRLKETKESYSENGRYLEDNGEIDLIYDLSTDTLELILDDGRVMYYERNYW